MPPASLSMPSIRILSIPGRGHENRFFRLLLEGLQKSGAKVIDPRLLHLMTFDFDVLCLNFPTHYITENALAKAVVLSAAFGAYLLLARMLGRKLIYIVHDVEPLKQRNAAVLWRFLRFVHALTDGYVFISKSSCRSFRAAYPGQGNKPSIIVSHGPYPTTQLTSEARAALRRLLVGEDDVFLLGFLGNIKPYKNPAALRAIQATLVNGRPVRTLIAGRIERGCEPEIQAIFDSLPSRQVIRIDRALTDLELDAFIQTVDVSLIPYSRGTNSGAAILVLANHGRFIGSGLPILKELAEEVGAPWVTISEAPDMLPRAIEEAALARIGEQDRRHLLAYLDQAGFNASAHAIHEFCRQLLRRTPAPR